MTMIFVAPILRSAAKASAFVNLGHYGDPRSTVVFTTFGESQSVISGGRNRQMSGAILPGHLYSSGLDPIAAPEAQRAAFRALRTARSSLPRLAAIPTPRSRYRRLRRPVLRLRHRDFEGRR